MAQRLPAHVVDDRIQALVPDLAGQLGHVHALQRGAEPQRGPMGIGRQAAERRERDVRHPSAESPEELDPDGRG